MFVLSRAGRAFENDVEALRAVRDLFAYLPPSWRQGAPVAATADSRARAEPGLKYLVPDDPNQAYDMISVVEKVLYLYFIYSLLYFTLLFLGGSGAFSRAHDEMTKFNFPL